MNNKDLYLDHRLLLRGPLSLGALTLLTGCDISDHDSVQSVLTGFSRWNDRMQVTLFSASASAWRRPSPRIRR